MNMTEIAEKLGVSQSTVSRVLNHRDKGRVSPKTAEMIRQYIQQSGFVRNNQASALRTGKSNVMGLILPWNVPELMDTIERECAHRNIDLLVQFTPEPDSKIEQKALDVMLQHQVDFLIWEPYLTCDIRLIERAKSSIRNIAILGDHPRVPDAIRFDYESGFRKIYHYAREKGFSRIAVVGTPQEMSGRLPDPREVSKELSMHCFQELQKTWLEEFLMPGTLFVCWNDWYGIELFQELEARQIPVFGEIDCIVIGDLLLGNQFRIGDIFRYPFTSLRRNFAAMGHAAVSCAAKDKLVENKSALIDMELCFRRSSL